MKNGMTTNNNVRHSASARGIFMRTLVGVALAVGLAGALGAATVDADQLFAGANVNVVGGPTCTKASDPNCPFQIFGDHTVQRQNEGSGGCSARNPANCFAAGNDYRLVNSGIVPTVDGKVTADAWQGIYWTHDGGSTWRSTLLPGFPGDTTPDGAVSPISGFEAAADPTVRPGVAGLLGVSGIAFNRVAEAAAAPISGGEGKSGVQFFSLYFDDNIPVDPDGPSGPLTYADVPPRYIRTVIVDSGTSGRFLDKPWHAWDIPRSGGNNTCTIPAGTVGGKSVPQQLVPSGNVYIAYATFLGSGQNAHGNIWFKSSTDCGGHWSNATKLTESVPISQSPFLSINPANGNIHVIWREFGQNGLPDRVLTVKSTNQGKTFTKAVEITSLGAASASGYSTAFDAFSLPTGSVTDKRQARSNDYPSACIGTDGKIRVVYSQRISQSAPLPAGTVVPDANGWSRIVMKTSTDGTSWSTPQAIDNPLAPGHMFQPSIVCTGTSATVMWYDQRGDNAFFLDPNAYQFVFSPFIIDPLPLPPVHTIDVRAAQTTSNGSAFEPSIQVSRYPVAFDTTGGGNFVQLQYDFVNWPLFGNGIVPFIGDYPDAFVKNPFKPPVGNSGWSFNNFATETPIVYALWTDNRDVLQLNSVPHPGDPNWVTDNVRNLSWTNFEAPGSSACGASTLTWTRNQNLYMSGLTRGVVVQAEGNARRSSDITQRAYVIFIQNQTPAAPGPDGQYGTSDDVNKKRFRLSFDSGSGPASFDVASTVTQIFVDVPSFSGVTRSVFLPQGSAAPVIVLVVEVDSSNTPVANGSKSSTIIAPDPNAPLDPITEENHDVSLTLTPLQVLDQNGQPATSLTYSNTSSAISPTFISPTFINPTFISNVLNPTFISPTFISPTFISPTFISPTFISPTFISPTFISPTFISPTFISPTFISPTFISPTFISQPLETDTTYAVTGTGTVTSSYDLDTLIASIPAGATFQILVSKLYATPGTTDCTMRRQVTQQLVSNVTSANISATPGDVVTSSSFSLAPGEQAIVTLRAACASDLGKCYDPNTDLSLVVKGHARNCKTTGCTEKPKQVIDHVRPKLTVPGHITVRDTGSPGEIVPYTATANDFVDGPITPQCSPASGSLFPVGDTTVTCTATDAAGNTATGSFVVTVLRKL
jgi:HYR domain